MRHLLAMIPLLGCVPYAPPVEPTPTASPSPDPTPEPVPVLFGPTHVPAKAVAVFYLCESYKPGTILLADKFPLGNFADNRESGCMQLVYPGFNQPGTRVLSANGHTWTVRVLPLR